MIQIKVKAGVPQEMDADKPMTFEQWIHVVDAYLIGKVGVSHDDLPDCNYMDWYEEKVRPIHAANRALAYAQDQEWEE